eukprot:CAMPEP_0119508940 /NCGR_PEP_ID=MMETSP1344-20130328/28399_1 /TAXON_ID=236787 /ORGANISM="Florenciella parvula, Strain CCMP2471" /LENGTH=47 /DNA_ID= /DNA_START= /DNA_END= /DNA_ORIENTATION=
MPPGRAVDLLIVSISVVGRRRRIETNLLKQVATVKPARRTSSVVEDE